MSNETLLNSKILEVLDLGSLKYLQIVVSHLIEKKLGHETNPDMDSFVSTNTLINDRVLSVLSVQDLAELKGMINHELSYKHISDDDDQIDIDEEGFDEEGFDEIVDKDVVVEYEEYEEDKKDLQTEIDYQAKKLDTIRADLSDIVETYLR